MSVLKSKIGKFSQVVAISVLLVLSLTASAMCRQAVMNEIRIIENPLSVKFLLTDTIPVKVIQVEQKELVVALKGVTLGKQFKISGKKQSVFRDVAVEQLAGNVIAVVLTSTRPYDYIQSGFGKSKFDYIVFLEKEKQVVDTPIKPVLDTKPTVPKPAAPSPQTPDVTKPKTVEPAPPEPQPVEKKVEQPPEKPAEPVTPAKKAVDPKPPGPGKEDLSSIPEPPVYVPPQREKSRFKGDISDLLRIVNDSECREIQVTNAVSLLRNKKFSEAFKVLEQYLMQESFKCAEAAYFLRAYAYYNVADDNGFAQLMKAEKYFQDALVSYPSSDYIPYGYAAIGMIQKKLNNMSAAEGYFNIVKQGYLAYSGMPEIMFHLADIYAEKGYLDKALRYYQQVFEDKVENSYIADAGIGYGKALFQKKQYLDTLSVLNYVVESSPKKVYESHELLLHIGNANYEIGQARASRIALNRVLNLYQEIRDPDVIMAKIGDTYGMENNEEKAIKIYELVREKYPDSQGYIASSIGIARYLKNDEEKIEIYSMIKNKFPENSFARIAMMRLAEIYQKQGEYNKCIQEIEDLLSTHPRGLRYEAVKLMQKAYEALFKRQLENDEYTKVINRYELDYNKLDRMGSRQISFSVGLAYLEAKLYDQAFNHLLTAYKQYKRAERSPQLLFSLGMAMDESGRDDDALKLFNAFAARYKKDKNRVEALLRSGAIYLDKKKYANASAKFNEAYSLSRSRLDRGRILMLHSAVFDKKGDMEKASVLQERAVKELALAKGDNYAILTVGYKELGRIYMALNLYVKAADAYVRALSFSDDDGEKANLGFLLGDAYQKGNIIPKAREAYKQVAQTYDSVWARMAQQRLNTLDLAESVQNS